MTVRNLPSPNQKEPGGEFVVQKAMTIGGVNFLPGATLPSDNVLRTMPHKLDLLCRIRALRQVAAPATITQTTSVAAATAVADTEAAPNGSLPNKPSVADLKAMNHKMLVALAKARGVSHDGDDKAIRIRIRKSYE